MLSASSCLCLFSREQEGTLLGGGMVLGTLTNCTPSRMKPNICSTLWCHRYGLARSRMCFQTGKQELGVGLCGNANDVTYK